MTDAPTPTSGVPRLKLKLNTPKTSTPLPSSSTTATETKQKRKYNKKPKAEESGDAIEPGASATASKSTKKRPRKDDPADTEASSGKKPKPIPKLSLKLGGIKTDIAPNKPSGAKTPLLKLRTKAQTLRLKSKGGLGVPPSRLPGQGYDSEADDVEVDPAVEHQFIIRMVPGDDCDYLRKAIAERTLGTTTGDVQLRFFDKDGRHAMVTIRGRQYAAILVDLPCIVEGHKSWDRKNFFKVADVHQMLIVTKQVQTVDEAKNAGPPDGVSSSNWQYPHGLTPPLHHVRKRRFRKRVSNRTIEAVEEEVDRLLRLDREALETTTEMLEPNVRDESEELQEDIGMVQNSIEMDAEGEDDDNMEEDDLTQMMMAALGDGNEDEEPILAGGDIQASPDTLQPTTETPDGEGVPAHTSPDDDSADDESDEDDEEMDEEQRAAQEERAQLREEADDIQAEIAGLDKQIAAQSNKILQQRLKDKKATLMRDLQLKLSNLGESTEDD
ncbi:hypothetical protein BT63DRAFT_5311 [Microthyrium microscopicum]|uniref:TAFII55 protein conserved region domain-containing protein n=1 Tax=Microthyrium microscopicum TaxID=703497 RepID=A0A6A6US54_9PEZI|nr:hypothetical protein BT63DRAFT_5311 [Microthyrium microscopicum]